MERTKNDAVGKEFVTFLRSLSSGLERSNDYCVDRRGKIKTLDSFNEVICQLEGGDGACLDESSKFCG